jgi:hypothetical protein
VRLLPVPRALQGRIDASAHGGNLVSHAEEASNLWQNLIGVMHKGLKTNAHCMDSQVNTPALGVALLLSVGFADVGSFFAGGARFAETL